MCWRLSGAGPSLEERLDYPEFITNWLMTNNMRNGNAGGGTAKQKGLHSVQALEFWLPDLDSNQGPAD